MNPPTAHLSHQVDVGAGPAFIHSLLHSFHCSIHHSSIHSTDPPACQSTHPFFHLLIHSSIPPPLHPSSNMITHTHTHTPPTIHPSIHLSALPLSQGGSGLYSGHYSGKLTQPWGREEPGRDRVGGVPGVGGTELCFRAVSQICRVTDG